MTSKKIEQLLENNKHWASRIDEDFPSFFSELSVKQAPEYLWIGCSDSRVPCNQILDLDPGNVFVHRNIANLANHNDLSFLAALQYAVDILKVKHIIVCGHYGCGGVQAAMYNNNLGLVDNWIRPIKNTYLTHIKKLQKFETQAEKLNSLCELNVTEQVNNVSNTTIVQQAWKRDQELAVHGLIYDMSTGRLKSLNMNVYNQKDTEEIFHFK
jgi:carbonic anhydrase